MLIATLAALAFAHVGLEEPPPRYPSDGFSNNKKCPCGAGTNDDLCSGVDKSDPNRSATVTVVQSGSLLTVQAHEVIGHTGRWRIAFDPDGADMADFNANILLDEPDPAGATGNAGGDLWVWTVQLPDITCDNCTLQITQIMNGNTVDPVPDPTGMSTYYQCADLQLVAALPLDTARHDTGYDHTGVYDSAGSDTGPLPDTNGVDFPTTDTHPITDTGATGHTGTAGTLDTWIGTGEVPVDTASLVPPTTDTGTAPPDTPTNPTPTASSSTDTATPTTPTDPTPTEPTDPTDPTPTDPGTDDTTPDTTPDGSTTDSAADEDKGGCGCTTTSSGGSAWFAAFTSRRR